MTSNADSGSGTLREALGLAAANGSSEIDYIKFNLPGSIPADKTIFLSSKLPDLTSSLVIDGTTQPGSKLGVSDAKVKLVANYHGNYRGMMEVFKQKDIEIYGLMFEMSATASNVYAFYLTGAKNFQLGRAQKGNVIATSIRSEYSFGKSDLAAHCEKVTISGNIIGLLEDGETLAPRMLMDLIAVIDLTIGGPDPADGNCINWNLNYVDYVFTSLSTKNLLIQNNRFGVNFQGNVAVPNARAVSNVSIFADAATSVEVKNNLVSGAANMGFTNIKCPVKIAGNKFGTDITGTQVLGIYDNAAIIVGDCSGHVLIGGSSAAERNIISGTWQNIRSSGLTASILNIRSSKLEVYNNSFRCNNTPWQLAVNSVANVPVINITSRTSNQIKGTATPNSRVDLYYSLSCSFCEAEQLIASVSADNSGNWVYSSVLQTGYNIIAASTLNGLTSEFTSLRFDYEPADVKIKMLCDGAKGGISGLKYKNAIRTEWYHEDGRLVASTPELTDAPVGKYRFVIGDGYCTLMSPYYEISDYSIVANLTNMKIKNAGCNTANGGITDIVSNGTSFSWRDQNNNQQGSALNLTNVRAGSYTLTISNGKYCEKTFGPFRVQIGGGLQIDESQLSVTNSTCNLNNGAITGIKSIGAVGQLTFAWRNSAQAVIGNSLDLSGLAPGTYILEVKDGSACSVFSSAVTVDAGDQLTISETSASTTPSACGSPTGAVNGIVVTGAAKYEWLDEGGNVFRTTSNANLTDAPGGKYKLRVSNRSCSKESKVFTITQPASVQFPNFPVILMHPCGSQTGSIQLDHGNTTVSAVQWRDEAGDPVSSNWSINNLRAGIYRLYLTDNNDCTNLYQTYTLYQLPPLIIDISTATIKNDVCDLGVGNIKGVKVSGGTGVFTYSWKNADGIQFGKESDLSLARRGSYRLEVSDGSQCKAVSMPLEIADDSQPVYPPVIVPVSICNPGTARIHVKNAVPGTYKLYSSEVAPEPIDQNSTGIFVVNATPADNYFLTYSDGACESVRSKVEISIAFPNIQIQNSFTPNGDGVNDYWYVKDLVDYPEATVQIYNRFGALIYKSRGYSAPFDGKLRGKELPAGTYYYIIELSAGCTPLKGSVSILR